MPLKLCLCLFQLEKVILILVGTTAIHDCDNNTIFCNSNKCKIIKKVQKNSILGYLLFLIST